MEEGERAFDKEIERRNVLQFLLLHLLSSPLPTDERDIHTRRHSLAAAHNAVTHGRERWREGERVGLVRARRNILLLLIKQLGWAGRE